MGAKAIMKKVATIVLVALLPLSAQDVCYSDAATAEIAMLQKQLAELTKQVNQMNQKAAILRMQLAQKDELIGFYMACAYAGIVPDGSCDVNIEGLSVSRKTQEDKQKK